MTIKKTLSSIGNKATGSIESTFYSGTYKPVTEETRSELEILYDAVMRSLDGVLRLTPEEVEFINNNRAFGSAVIDCSGAEVELCREVV